MSAYDATPDRFAADAARRPPGAAIDDAAGEPARWPACSRCSVREAKPGVWCPHQLARTRCPWVLDADGRIAVP